MTQDQKDKLADWLQQHFTGGTNIGVIVDHIERYYCPSPGEALNQLDPEIIEQIETVLSQNETSVELAHRRDLIDLLYVHYLAGRSGEGGAIMFTVWDNINNREASAPVYMDQYGKLYADQDPHGVDMSGKRRITPTDKYTIRWPGKVRKDVTTDLTQDFKELNHYFDALSQPQKDAGNLWIAFTDKFRAFENKVLSMYTAPAAGEKMREALDRITKIRIVKGTAGAADSYEKLLEVMVEHVQDIARQALSQPPGNDEWVKASVGSLIVNIDEFTATDSPIRHLNNYRKLKDWSLLTNPTQ